MRAVNGPMRSPTIEHGGRASFGPLFNHNQRMDNQ